MLALTVKLYRVTELRTYAKWLGGLAVLQVATGLGNVLLGWPLLAAVAHTGGAAALVVVLTSLVLRSLKETRIAQVTGPVTVNANLNVNAPIGVSASTVKLST